MKAHVAAETSRARRLARARQLLRGPLGFVGGFPCAVDGAARARAMRALRELADLHDELEVVVGDAGVWRRGVERLLERLAGGGEAFAEAHGFSREVRKRARALASLAPLVEAISWVTMPAPSRAGRLLGWLEERRAELEALLAAEGEGGVALALRLHALEREAAPLVRDLLDPRTRAVPLVGGRQRAKALHDQLVASSSGGKLTLADPPAPPYAELREWLAVVEAMPGPLRRRAMDLYALLDLPAVLGALAGPWRQLEGLERRARAAIRHAGPAPELIEEAALLERGWPWEFALSTALEVIPRAAADARAVQLLVEVAPLVPSVSPGHRALRLADVFVAVGMYDWRNLRALFTAMLGARSLEPAQRRRVILMLAGKTGDTLRLREMARRWTDVPAERILAAATALGRGRADVSDALAARCATLTGLVGDGEKAAALALAADGLTPTMPALRSAALMCRDDPTALRDILTRLQGLAEQHASTVSAWARRGRVADARALLIAGFGKQLARAGSMVDLVEEKRAAQLLPAPSDEVPPWAERFPAALHPALARLASALPDAEAQAARHLKELLPGAPRPDGSVRPPRAVGAVRLAHLAERVDLAARRGMLERWLDALSRATRERIAERLGIDELPAEWIEQPKRMDCVVAASHLPPNSLAMARKVFARRLGPPPWDLREEPQNRAFLDRLRRRGIDVGPWLDGIGAQVVERDGKPVTLALEPDPLELLEMGGHFGSCLSPDQCNYFSVFANLIDINKRVIYARDGAGKVVGRCLLGLTAVGGLLGFHAYHHGEWPFDEHVRDFVAALAAAMKTIVVPRGEVPRLLAHDWYDDGPVDLTGKFGCFAEGSPLRASLDRAQPDEVVALVEAALASSGRRLDELTLPMVVDLPELDTGKGLAAGLLPLAAQIHELPWTVLYRLVYLAQHAPGGAEASARWLGQSVLRAAQRDGQKVAGPPAVFRAIAAAHPSEMVAFLRATRTRGVRDWSDETSGERLAAAGEAMMALRRPRQAIALFRMVTPRNASIDTARVSRERKKSLLRATT